ncbi:hypothetical protein LCGC14_3047790 [marine sediment metagenome]|uniref:Uncharacterized protein n=1 Tax=marine sediment metagenome TaxID=412755 RepID=A0A0F8YVI9_9ZZZZ
MSKGFDFERETVKLMSLWWTQDLDEPRDDIFYKTSGSGARHTSRMKKGISTYNSAGDMGFLDPLGEPFINKFLVEMKRGYTNTGRVNSKDIKKVIKEDSHYEPLTKNIHKYITNKVKKSGDIIDVLDFVDTNKLPLLYKWWEKAEKERKEAKREASIIIFKRDMKNACVMMDADVLHELMLLHSVNNIIIQIKKTYLIILSLHDFIENVDPSTIGG